MILVVDYTVIRPDCYVSVWFDICSVSCYCLIPGHSRLISLVNGLREALFFFRILSPCLSVSVCLYLSPEKINKQKAFAYITLPS